MHKHEKLKAAKTFIIDGLSKSVDVEIRPMKSATKQAELLYIKSICDPQTIKRYIVSPFWEIESSEEFENYLASFPECEPFQDVVTAVESILQGSVMIFLADNAYLLDAKKHAASPVSDATVESGVQGPNDAFNEDLLNTLSMVRARFQSDALRVEMKTIGELSRTKVAIVYDESIVDQVALQSLHEELAKVNVKVLQAAGELERHISGKWWNIFPKVIVTERPDRVVRNLSHGKIAVFVDKTAFAIVLPASFSDFFTAMDDYWQATAIGWFLKILRYIGFAATITLPALYVGTISYNPEFFKVQLAFSIVASRAAVPYASYLEVIFMLVMMEFLTEASIRLPKAIGPTATTVGGLILGQAATQAGLISNILIIIVAVVGISSYVIPILEMGLALRVLKYVFLGFASIGGLVGIIIGFILLTFYLASLTSFGRPYMQMVRKGEKA